MPTNELFLVAVLFTGLGSLFAGLGVLFWGARHLLAARAELQSRTVGALGSEGLQPEQTRSAG